jgi:hypothetical protein
MKKGRGWIKGGREGQRGCRVEDGRHGRMEVGTDRETDEQKDRWRKGGRNRLIDCRRMDRGKDRRMGRGVDKVWTEGWTEGSTEGWTEDGLRDERRDGW